MVDMDDNFASIHLQLESIRNVLIDIGSRIEALELMQRPKGHDNPNVWSGEVYSHYRKFCNDKKRRGEP
jgi:hypothetical protein